ncbi:hypothetical protein ASF22_19905 [Methylobacterium sp. Leaf87]|uniref:hypothetical protein n=1 Tax=Methylobacterium sp. Leaf87 TaxID=1736243 RepID=UPI0006F4444E|nr:hypothetical protein [Methylobacterium sp. Leaf87]KQO68516.1 hypothetical protein ASF22_19905 [Methylobacterium sp. Leaf87]
MPWYRTPKADYSHLRGVDDDTALQRAIRSPTYGEAHQFGLMADYHGRIAMMWGAADVLRYEHLVVVHEATRASHPSFFGFGRHWVGAFLHDVVGNLVGHGLRLGVLEEISIDGGRAFKLVRREPLFERTGSGSWRRITERSGRGAAQREAYRVRHAAGLDAEISELVGRLCAGGAAIPDGWYRRYPEQFGALRGLAVLVSDARPTIETAHRTMHLVDQKWWVRGLGDLARNVRPAPAAAVPDEDLESLGSLA